MRKIILLSFICMTLVLCSGCSKDGILNVYKNVNEKVGDFVLTRKTRLMGTRIFGEDHYTGIYDVTYDRFNGEEVLFGGTTTSRDSDNIHIDLKVEDSLGSIKIYMRLKDEVEVLAEEDGDYEFDFNVKSGSNYLIIDGDNYSGKVYMEIK